MSLLQKEKKELHSASAVRPAEKDGKGGGFEEGNPFGEAMCKLNLKEESSEFVRAFPMGSRSWCNEGRGSNTQRRNEGLAAVGQRRLDTPSTPGRPVFGFSGASLGRKSVPSKWEDAEKWLISSSSCHDSPAHVSKPSDQSKVSKQSEGLYQKGDAFPENLKVLEEKLQRSVTTSFRDLSLDPNSGLHGFSSDVFLKDKFTERVEPMVQGTAPSTESFFFSDLDLLCDGVREPSTEELAAAEAHHRRDVGTEMTPFGSCTTSRCHTPIKVPSPARHNTPVDKSGVLLQPKPSIDMSELKGRHLAMLGAQFVHNWSSKEEEDEEISKSLRHFELDGGRKSVAESMASAWEDEEKSKSCARYQREEAKIQAWVNLQTAKADAQSKKLEVKIQKMRCNLEEKLMKKMANVHHRAEEWRAAARSQHSEQMQRVQEQAEKMMRSRCPPCRLHDNVRCGCLPCSNNISNHPAL